MQADGVAVTAGRDGSGEEVGAADDAVAPGPIGDSSGVDLGAGEHPRTRRQMVNVVTAERDRMEDPPWAVVRETHEGPARVA